ncbi:hypothetical protein L6452_37222 [Arctium lappa]|uniref:Uncharacterized protein n=1 Tax=Arctium lappa TaxID=4217 RepID=A0ACB8Y2W5_ARCLA|nr:hypothetical protein L6452_37222 [Arctium lappa]
MDFIPKLKAERMLSNALNENQSWWWIWKDAYSEYMQQCGTQIASVYVLWFVTVVFVGCIQESTVIPNVSNNNNIPLLAKDEAPISSDFANSPRIVNGFHPKELKTERMLSNALNENQSLWWIWRDAYSEYMQQCGTQIASVYVLWFVTVVFVPGTWC